MANNSEIPAELEEALSLHHLEPGLWKAIADVRYEANTGMFGGWTAALLLTAVTKDDRALGTPSTLTVHFVNRIPPGSELRVRATPMGGGRSITHWQAQILDADQDTIMAFASIVMATRRPSDQFLEWSMPEVTLPEKLALFSPPGTFGERTQIMIASGFPPFSQENTTSLAWVREQSGRALDAIQLAYQADVYPPRIWYIGKDPRPSATLTMSVYFHAASDELSSVKDDFVLSDVTGTRGEHSTVGSQARLWSRSGTLLATTEQLCWFK